jgi:hypothetical protein
MKQNEKSRLEMILIVKPLDTIRKKVQRGDE